MTDRAEAIAWIRKRIAGVWEGSAVLVSIPRLRALIAQPDHFAGAGNMVAQPDERRIERVLAERLANYRRIRDSLDPFKSAEKAPHEAYALVVEALERLAADARQAAIAALHGEG